MSSYWSGKGVVVTGASSGLGFAIAQAAAASGAKVVVAARGADALDAAVERIRQAGGDAHAFRADVTNEAEVHDLAKESLDRLGRVDLLVNCAGKSARGAALETTPDDFRHLLEVNLISTVICTRAFAKELISRRGHLVNIGSLAGKSAARWLGAYAAAKFAVTGYTQQLRLELEPQGLHVMLVCPGPIARTEPRQRDTDRLDNIPAEAATAGAGVKTSALNPTWLAQRILDGCERRRRELVYPRTARLLFAISQLSPSLGDQLVRWMT
ncbi:MAG: SDR family NAD(P)-dependent oxidoreductase [Planctomycetia bacterium]|nr:SDR family NAD(P)-dependent oxidoreductase [Planctomycetia bacterium]